MARRTYPPDETSQLKEIASYVTRAWHDRAFASLVGLIEERAHARFVELLGELAPHARAPRGILVESEDLPAHHAKQDAALLAAQRKEPSPGALGEEETALLEAIEAALRPRDAHEEALWRAVYADPASDDARLVLADALTQRGDPRGPFIVMQCDRRGDGPRPARTPDDEKVLLKRFGQIWLGRLQFLLAYPVYRRGFVAEGKYVGNDHPEQFEVAEWSTLEALEFEHKAIGYRELLQPTLRHLRRAHGLDGDLLARAEREGRSLAIEHLGACAPFDGFVDAARRGKVLPRLRRLDLLGHRAPAALADLARAGLPELGVEADVALLPRVAGLLAEAPALTAITVGLRASWSHPDESWSRWSVRVARARDRAGGLDVDATHHGGDGPDELLAALRDLPVASLRLARRGRPRAAPDAVRALSGELAARGVELALAGW